MPSSSPASFPIPFFRAKIGAALVSGALAIAPFANAADYALPAANAETPSAFPELQAFSHATSSLAKTARKALVFISIAKTVKGQPLAGTMDPFEFFFGPGGPGGAGPGGRGQPAPRGRGPGGPQAEGPRQEGLGSGFFVDLAKGYVLTNNHVVEGADEIHLKVATGETYTGKVVGRDDKTDVAVVKVDAKDFERSGLGELRLGDSDKLEVGDFVIALGAPFGLEASLSQGVISATGRGNLDITQLGDFIQTDAAINPGNSGGPLLDAAGRVIGINSAIYSRSGAYNGIGFAVPSNIVRTVAEELVNEGRIERGYVGLSLQEISPDLAPSLKLPANTSGALVAQVQPRSPAAKAGFEPGDVVTKVNDRPVSSVSMLTNTIGLMKPGRDVGFHIFRDGKDLEIKATVASWPKERRIASSHEEDRPAEKDFSAYGLAVGILDEEARSQYQLTSSKGVLIEDVEPNSAAARVGLKAGDLIVAADNKAVTDVSAFEKLSANKERLLLRVERAGDFFYVPLKRS